MIFTAPNTPLQQPQFYQQLSLFGELVTFSESWGRASRMLMPISPTQGLQVPNNKHKPPATLQRRDMLHSYFCWSPPSLCSKEQKCTALLAQYSFQLPIQLAHGWVVDWNKTAGFVITLKMWWHLPEVNTDQQRDSRFSETDTASSLVWLDTTFSVLHTCVQLCTHTHTRTKLHTQMDFA